ncbi:MAG: response regulator [Calditrichaeota bacterium]|nr:response regulator [Calditrichota bacterium]
MRMLVTEDVELMQKLLRRFLEPYGEISFARGGHEAFRQFKDTVTTHKYFDLICLDIDIPEINGLDLLKNIRVAEKLFRVPLENRAKIVMVSSTNDANIVMKAIKLGCNGYIVKPFGKERIVSELKKLGLIKQSSQTQTFED